ncbi:MAG TPA: TatD family hydrolase [Opitutaceae bacterium]|nr:TatD family hydrolase [Opitutaceae bacterium]
MLYDAHNHLQDSWLVPHRRTVFADLAKIPLGGAVVNGTEEGDWPAVAALAREHAFIRPSYGLHPWNVGNASLGWREELQRHLDRDSRAAMGEIGLDRWILERARPDDSRLAGLRRASLEEQVEAFTWQVALAAERNLPVSIHCLDAWGALADALRAAPRPTRGFLLHAYGGSAEMARDFAALGAYFSFNGYFLGERQSAKREVFKTLPLDRLLVETDAPAMPLPERRRTHSLPGLADGNPINHPANLGAVYAGLAEVRGVEVCVLETKLEENFTRLFGRSM